MGGHKTHLWTPPYHWPHAGPDPLQHQRARSPLASSISKLSRLPEAPRTCKSLHNSHESCWPVLGAPGPAPLGCRAGAPPAWTHELTKGWPLPRPTAAVPRVLRVVSRNPNALQGQPRAEGGEPPPFPSAGTSLPHVAGETLRCVARSSQGDHMLKSPRGVCQGPGPVPRTQQLPKLRSDWQLPRGPGATLPRRWWP